MKKTTALLALAALALAASYVALAPFAEFMARTFQEGIQ